MHGAIPPLLHASAWHDAYLATGTSLLLFGYSLYVWPLSIMLQFSAIFTVVLKSHM
jgi:hypothetical protein